MKHSFQSHRSPENTTFTWSLTKELKAKLILLCSSEQEGEKLVSSWLNKVMPAMIEERLKKHGIEWDDAMIDHLLEHGSARSWTPERRKITELAAKLSEKKKK